MVLKLGELTEEAIANMSEKELRENLLNTKTNAIKASNELGALKSKGGKDEKDTFTKEEVEEQVKAELEKKEFFDKNSDLSDSAKESVEKIKGENGNLTYNQALMLAKSNDETIGNNSNSNNSSLDGGGAGEGSDSKKLSLDEYNKLSDSGKEEYEKMSEEKFGGFDLEAGESKSLGDMDDF